MLDDNDLNDALRNVPGNHPQTEKEAAEKLAKLNLQQLEAALTEIMGQFTGKLELVPTPKQQQAWRQQMDQTQQASNMILGPKPQLEPDLSKEPGKIFRYTPDPTNKPKEYVDFNTASRSIRVDYTNPLSVAAAMKLTLALAKRGLCNAIAVPTTAPESVRKGIAAQCKAAIPPIQFSTFTPKPTPAPVAKKVQDLIKSSIPRLTPNRNKS